jgi:hypothetical protein
MKMVMIDLMTVEKWMKSVVTEIQKPRVNLNKSSFGVKHSACTKMEPHNALLDRL